MKLSFYRSILIICCLFVYGWSFSFTPKKKGRDISEIPNPKIDPVACGRETVPHSSICDPDNVLTKDIKDEIEGYLNAMKEVEIAVVIINRMDVSGSASKVSGTEKKAEMFARSLHDTWGVGDKETNKGVLLFISIYDRVIYFSTGDGVSKTLNSEVIESLISGMRQYLKRGDYGTAIIHTVIEMDLLLTRKIKATYGASGTVKKQVASESTGETIIVFLVFFGFLGFGFLMNYFQNRKMRNYERGREQLDKLMKEVDNVKENKFASTSCPICLEDFPVPFIPTATSTLAQNPVQTTPVEAKTEELIAVKKDKKEVQEDEEKIVETVKQEETPTAEPVILDGTPASGITDELNAAPTATPTIPSQVDHERKPMALKCGHIFCRSCLEEYLSKQDGNKCPICRADIDDDPPNSGNGNSTRPPQPRRSSNTFRNRRGFFPFQPQTNIHTLWNYHPTTQGFGAQSQGAQYNPGSGTYTQTTQNPAYNHYIPELRYRLYRIHHYYPDAVTAEALRSMNSAIDRGSMDELRTHVVNRGAELNRLVTEIREASQQSSRNSGMQGSYSSSFSGGRSSGGGGGRW